MKILKTVCSLILFMPFLVVADPGNWMPISKKISSIMVEGDDNGKALIILEDGGVPTNYIPAECRNGSNATYNTILLNTDKGKAMFALALSAHASGKSLKLAVTCIGIRPLITNMWVY